MWLTYAIGRQIQDSKKGYNNQSHRNSLELPLFDLATVIKATDSFSHKNKLGEGGFGPVYKVTSFRTKGSWTSFLYNLSTKEESQVNIYQKINQNPLKTPKRY